MGPPGAGGQRRARIADLPRRASADRPVNNARIIAARIYRTRLALFERWYEDHGNDIAASVAALSELEKGAEGDEAFERLEGAVEKGREQ